MSTQVERQLLGYLRHLSEGGQNNRDFVSLLDRGSDNRDTGMISSNIRDRIVVSVYNLKAKPATPETVDESKPPAKPAKPTITVKINGFLTEQEPYLIESETIVKEGQHTISLPCVPVRHQISVEVDGVAEYAVFGL